ncbi:MAG: transcriptional repressor LexA [Eubacterium sp.]|nr:transcriptional repressor LexA [Eubacterium sp.]
MPGKISAKQQQILDYIKEEILKKGYPPTVREICEKVGLKSTSSVHSHLSTLEENGYIRRDPTKPRAIEIMDDEFGLTRREMANIPIVGRVAAGEPLLAVENIEDYFSLPVEFMPSGESFILKVHGDSMINVGFFENDYLIVEKQSNAKNGDIVVALIEDSVTVKRFYKEDGHYRLQPENDNMDPIIVDDCTVVGVVRSLYRRMVI